MAKTKQKIKQKIYTLSGRINEVPFSKQTKNIDKTLLELKPEFVFCDTYITLSRGKIKTERKLNLTQGKRLFLDENVREVFVNNLMMEFA